MTVSTLPSSWRQVKLAQIASKARNAIVDGPFGSNLKLSDYVASGVPVLQGKNITNDRFHWFDVRYISDAKAQEPLERIRIAVGDSIAAKHPPTFGWIARIDIEVLIEIVVKLPRPLLLRDWYAAAGNNDPGILIQRSEGLATPAAADQLMARLIKECSRYSQFRVQRHSVAVNVLETRFGSIVRIQRDERKNG